jgi:hypothetical protein
MMEPIVYIPTFLPAYKKGFANGEDKQHLNRQLLLKDWITPDLQAEIIPLYPSASEKEPDNGQRDDSFSCRTYFASFKQLDQAAKLFLDAWAILKVLMVRVRFIVHMESLMATSQQSFILT